MNEAPGVPGGWASIENVSRRCLQNAKDVVHDRHRSLEEMAGMRPTGIRILDRSGLRHYPQPGSSLSCVTLTSLARNKSVAARQIAAPTLSVPCKSDIFWRFSPGASTARLAGILPAGSQRQASGLGVVPSLPSNNSRVGAGAAGSASITFRVVGGAA